MSLLRRLSPGALPTTRRVAVDQQTLEAASRIVDDVRRNGEAGLRTHAEHLGDLKPGAPLVVDRDGLRAAYEASSAFEQSLLQRTAERVRRFAVAQRATLNDLSVAVEGGIAGHTIRPVERAGCYAPGGRFPLPSSVLMTAVTARTAGVQSIIVASPRPARVTLAAAHVADADGLLVVGGAQAIAALAYGAGPVVACDVIVGPGNRWVTAAKQLVSGHVGIDMLAGPSELVILADGDADAELVAADLLAQAEHDPDALPILVTTSSDLTIRVEAALEAQLATLPTADTARPALSNGFVVECPSLEVAITVCDALAPEHLEVLTVNAAALRDRFANYGGLFLGAGAAEVLGDYGAGPNHVLPTGGTSRFVGGLSVFTFLRIRTFLTMTDPRMLAIDAAALARLEGLEGHARAADRRS